ncbi:MAG: GerMN domain-containing protein [bacterium]|nr:GerMN domain-containing protein [bacterium]
MTKKWVALSIVTIVLFAGAWVLYAYTPNQELERDLVNSTQQQIAQGTDLQESPYREITLFVGDVGRGDLLRKIREIEKNQDLLQEISQTIELLIQPDEDMRNDAIPEGTTLLNVFISRAGIAYLNLSRHVQVRHIGGLSAELTSVASLVNTLLFNFKQIKQVQILVEGAEIETLTGHVDCRKPFSKLLLIGS